MGLPRIGAVSGFLWCPARCVSEGATPGGSPRNPEDPRDTHNHPSPHRENSAPTIAPSLAGGDVSRCVRERDEGKSDRLVPQFGVSRVWNPSERAALRESLYQSTRDTYPPHFSRLSLRACVNDAASRAQVDVESAAHDRDRPVVPSDGS